MYFITAEPRSPEGMVDMDDNSGESVLSIGVTHWVHSLTISMCVCAHACVCVCECLPGGNDRCRHSTTHIHPHSILLPWEPKQTGDRFISASLRSHSHSPSLSLSLALFLCVLSELAAPVWATDTRWLKEVIIWFSQQAPFNRTV